MLHLYEMKLYNKGMMIRIEYLVYIFSNSFIQSFFLKMLLIWNRFIFIFNYYVKGLSK